MATCLLAAAMTPVVAPVVTAGTPQVKVVLVVGPVGPQTDDYRALEADAARAARRWTSNVVEVVSPNATWPAVRRALQGASIVVYLGHGNGWPSPYSSRLQPLTQDGFGLNPVAGEDDTAHQYFGEAYLARDIHLAPHAIVLLNHLCYASGNSEPGVPEGSATVARQRIDNFAAGWLAAGADDVLVDSFFGPAWYINAVMGGHGTVESMWRSAPSFHDHVTGFASTRTPGTRDLMDPDGHGYGFHRSLAGRPDLNVAQVRGGPAPATHRGPDVRGNGGGRPATGGGGTGTGGSPGAIASPPPATVVSPASLGATIGAPDLSASSGVLVVGLSATLRVPIVMPPSTALPAGSQIGLRWVPMVLDAPSQPGPAVRDAGAGTPPGGPILAATAPEVAGDVVATVPTRDTNGTLTATVSLPPAAGLYRLVTTLHDAGGTAYDAATQALVAPIMVRLSGRVSVTFGAVPTRSMAAGDRASIDLRVANDGAEPWTDDPPWTLQRPTPFVLATWTALGVGVDTSREVTAVPIRLAPGHQAVVSLPLIAPPVPGSYLVVLDLVSPEYGSLLAMGLPATAIRVTVTPSLTVTPLLTVTTGPTAPDPAGSPAAARDAGR
jgi:hypothetical protein